MKPTFSVLGASERLFCNGRPQYGTDGNYVDYLAKEFTVINPGSSTGSVSFSRGAPGAGTGEFDIHALAPLTTITGAINIDYAVFSQDPNSPTFDPGSFVSAGTLSANAEVEVTSPVPEPGSAGLTGLALLPMVIAWCRRRKPQRS